MHDRYGMFGMFGMCRLCGVRGMYGMCGVCGVYGMCGMQIPPDGVRDQLLHVLVDHVNKIGIPRELYGIFCMYVCIIYVAAFSVCMYVLYMYACSYVCMHACTYV